MQSQQQHTIPRWLLENFTDQDGMLHLASNDPRTCFRSKPRNVFRRRDYYAAKQIEASLESDITKMESLFLPRVKEVLRVARDGIDRSDLSSVKAIPDDIRGCALLLWHLAYRSPQWLGEDYFSGMHAIGTEFERVGQDLPSAMREESTKLILNCDLVLVFSQVDAPTFVLGDCGPFPSRDAELGVDNEAQKRRDPDWAPAEQRMWMALSPEVALGVATREADAEVRVNVMPNSEKSADWVDHFNEICARHSRMIAGASKKWVSAASEKAWGRA